MYARILVFLPLKIKTAPYLDYSIPAKMSSAIQPGVLVTVPMRERVLPGMVMVLTDTPAVSQTRDIKSVLDPEPALSAKLLDLARWMSRETLAPLHKCVQTMLPPGLRPRVYLKLTARVSTVPEKLPKPAEALLTLLIQRGTLTSAQVKQALKGVDLRRARYYLKKRKLIKVERLLRMSAVRPKSVQKVRLIVPRPLWDDNLHGLRKLDLYRRVLEFLEHETQPVELSVVYAETGAQIGHLKMLDKRDLVAFSREEILRDPLAEMIFMPDQPPTLTPEQQAAWDTIEGMLTQGAGGDTPAPVPVLLLGVTGSGKTELYLRATANVLAQGKQALVLVPEISLTPQTVRRFVVRFPGQVGLWHSGMSEGERFDTWRRVRGGDVSVVVGARSALFAPFADLGLIVMDEEEDTSYKQGSAPYYHTREVAEKLAGVAGALLILGSATPSLDSYARALEGRYRLLEMPRRILGHQKRLRDWGEYLHLPESRYQPVDNAPHAATIPLPPVQIVDMRAELKAGNRSVFSAVLQDAVDHALSRQEQTILFLNRRGTATYVFCRDCGWVAECPRCDIPLTYHAGINTLTCHRCGHQRRMPRQCPACNSTRVRAFGLGTEGLEKHVAERWPNARIVRWDRDVARSHAMHTAIMGRFTRGAADILVGTQMVARGLDIPKVTVVGVISADTALNLPDFRAAERAFQLLAQVAGRSGRGVLGGRVVLQTYHPDHYAVQRAAVHDFKGFARRELAFRERADYPPSIRLARLVFSHANREKTEQTADKLAATLREALRTAGLPSTDLIGPAPAFFARVRGRYRWQILLRSVNPADFLRDVDIPAGWLVDIDPVDVL